MVNIQTCFYDRLKMYNLRHIYLTKYVNKIFDEKIYSVFFCLSVNPYYLNQMVHHHLEKVPGTRKNKE